MKGNEIQIKEIKKIGGKLMCKFFENKNNTANLSFTIFHVFFSHHKLNVLIKKNIIQNFTAGAVGI